MRTIGVLIFFIATSTFATVAKSSKLSSLDLCQQPLKAEVTQLEKNGETVAKGSEKSRLYYYMGRCAMIDPNKNTDVALGFFQKGLAVAETALEVKSDDWEALFWWGANKGSIADVERDLSSLKTIKTIEEKMLQMRDENPDYGYAGPNRVLGKIYQNAPRFISIGSSSKAENAFKAAYDKFPNFPGNVIALAEFYEDEGRSSEAKKILLPLVASQAIKKQDFGIFNIEKTEWENTIQAMLKKWGR